MGLTAGSTYVHYNPNTHQFEGWDPDTGRYVLVAGSSSLLSTTTLSMTTPTVVNTGTEITFDTVLRDDLGLAIAGTGRIRIPSNATQFRLIYDIALTSTIVGTYRKVIPNTVFNGTPLSLAATPMRPHTVIPFTTVTASVYSTINASSQLVDVASLLSANGVTFAGNNTDYFSLTLAHDATASTISVLAGSTVTLETYTPV